MVSRNIKVFDDFSPNQFDYFKQFDCLTSLTSSNRFTVGPRYKEPSVQRNSRYNAI